MAAFIPNAGRSYAAERNYDRGPEVRSNVSTLSPYLRTRALTEIELLKAVLRQHSLAWAEKFVQEIFWRTYWKGWLEAHPAAWTRYWNGLEERLRDLEADPSGRAAHDRAVTGTTGIDAFDTWARELVAVNYLHNHARMWFASIWIFTLDLPWELGADFFMRNLLDGDPASNTLSWRWVAGLHTRGRTYTATRDNIRRYTEGRFSVERPLARSGRPLDDPAIPLVALSQIPDAAVRGTEPSLLVLHEDDLYGDVRELPANVRGVCAIAATRGRSPRPMHPNVVDFTEALLREASSRAATHAAALDCGLLWSAQASRLGGSEAGRVAIAGPGASDVVPAGAPDLVTVGAPHVVPVEISDGARASAFGLTQTESGALIEALRAAASACGATRIVAPYAPVGPVRDILDNVRTACNEMGLSYAEFGRRYDAVSWPAATRGFFNLRSRIPTILAEAGIGAG